MSTRITCTCGRSYSVKDQLRGKKVKCPKCGAALAVPDSVDAATCPHCRSTLLPNAVLCVSCGFDLKTGQMLVTESLLGDVEVDALDGGTARYSVTKTPDDQRTIRIDRVGADSETVSMDGYETIWYVQKPVEFTPLSIVIVVLGCMAGFIPGLIILYWLYKNRDYKYLVQLRGKPHRKTVIFEAREESKRDALAVARMIHQATGIGYHEEIGVD